MLSAAFLHIMSKNIIGTKIVTWIITEKGFLIYEVTHYSLILWSLKLSGSIFLVPSFLPTGACSKGSVMDLLEVSSGHITLPLLSAVQL